MRKGFTLSELLIALAILGVIATFTIPKVLQSQQDSKNKTIAKEAASIISGAFDAYKLKNNTSRMGTYDLTPYINYVSIDTVSLVNGATGAAASYSCATEVNCMRLHNGAILYHWWDWFCPANPTIVHYQLDVDGKLTSGASDTVPFVLYSTGRLQTWEHADTSAQWTNGGAGSACGLSLSSFAWSSPSWFSWN